MDRIIKFSSADVLIDLPETGCYSLLRRLKRRGRPLFVFAEKAPLLLPFFAKFRRLSFQKDDIRVLSLLDFSAANEDKVLTLFSGTPNADAFLARNTAALEPFFTIERSIP